MADPHDATAHTLTTHTHTHAATTGQGAGDHHAEDHDHDGSPTQKLLAANSHESPSADTHHAKVHGDAEHPVMGRMKVIRKTADETISLNQVSQDDDELFFAIGANEAWVFSGSVISNSGATEDFRMQVAGPAGSSGFFTRVDSSTTAVPLGTDITAIAGTGADVCLTFVGSIENGGTAGNLQVKWAQNLTGATNCIVREHSFLMAHRVT